MKCLLIFIASIFLLNTGMAQLRTDVKTATTTTLPEGTSAKDGKIMIATGYKAIISPNDNNVVIIQKVSNNRTSRTVVTGSFTCVCSDENKTNDCSAVVREQALYCTGEKCGSDCKLYTTIKPSVGLAITRESKGVEWKQYKFPARTQ